MSSFAYLLSGLLFILTASGHAQGPGTTVYTLADLEILERERAHAEFFAHAFDVRPSERGELWKKMMENMGETYLKTLAGKTRLERSDFRMMEDLMKQSVLRQHEFFIQRRQTVALKWFQQCLSENSNPDSPCWQDLLSFWEKDRQDIDLAPRLLTTVGPFLALHPVTDSAAPSQRARAEITPLFILRPMLQDPIAGAQCRKPDVREVVWQEAIKRWNNTMTPAKYLQELGQIAHASCWDELTQWARSFLIQGGTGPELDVTYQLLLRQGEMTPVERDLYLMSYLLGSPARGDVFNLAWNRVQELGLLAQEREKLLEHFKRWRPLPGLIFADLDLTKRRAVTRHLRQHFPEFIDYYAHVCIDFFGGKKRFPDGNPAHSCRQMFELANSEQDLLPAPMVEVFKQSLTL